MSLWRNVDLGLGIVVVVVVVVVDVVGGVKVKSIYSTCSGSGYR